VQDNGSKETFFDSIRSTYSSGESVTLSFQEISDAISRQKKGKAAGPDDIAMEAYMFSNTRLSVHLNLLFDLFSFIVISLRCLCNLLLFHY